MPQNIISQYHLYLTTCKFLLDLASRNSAAGAGLYRSHHSYGHRPDGLVMTTTTDLTYDTVHTRVSLCPAAFYSLGINR